MPLIIERQRETNQFIRSLSKQIKKSRIKHIDILKDYFIDWNNILKNTSPEYWEKVITPKKIEQYIIERNRRHLHQSHGTPCTIAPLASLLGTHSFTQFGNQILERWANLDNKTHSTFNNYSSKNLKSKQELLRHPFQKTHHSKQMSDSFRCWKESTSISPSKYHLGHYKCLLTSDGK